MPTVVGTQLNNVLVANWTVAELNAGNSQPFITLNLEGNPNSSVYIESIEFGANVSTADAGIVSLIVQIARNLIPDPSIIIFNQIDDGVSGLSPSRLYRPYFRFVKGFPFDRESNWTKPIELDPGINHCVVLGVGLDTTATTGLDAYLLVRGRWGAPNEKTPRLRKII